MAKKVSRVTRVAARQEDAQESAKQMQATTAELTLVSNLAQIQLQRELDVARCEDALRDAKDALRQVSEVDLPEAMREVGIKTFTTTDGLLITVKPEVQCSIAVANRDAAYQWLIDNDYGGIIKVDVSVHFDSGQQERAHKFADQLTKKGADVKLEQTVHAQTLKAFVKERIADTESTVAFPLELFGARPYTKAVVKAAKK